MALPLAKAAPLKPQIRLAQALSEFEAVLDDDQKSRFRTYRGQSAPTPTDVTRFTAEIDRDSCRNRKSRQCVGTRLTNVLHSVQQFSTVADLIVGSSQSQIAGAIWGTVRLSLQLASAISSYFDQLSTLFMRIGLTCPRYQDLGLLYPKSTRLQSALCGYFVVIVRLCKQAVVFLKKPFWSQLSSSILKPFESEFGNFHQDLENLASSIREEISLASNQAQQDEAKEMSKFRAFAMDKLSGISTKDLEEAKEWKRKNAEFLFLSACSVYNHEESWKQARKRGNTNWICYDEGYNRWKQESLSSTLWCTGILGSGKTVLSANVVENLKITTPAVVAYFFCRYDEVESLQTRTILGSIARQIFDHIKPDIVSEIATISSGTIDTYQVLDYIQRFLPSNSHDYFIVIDGLDECEEKESRLLLQCLKQLLMSKTALRVYCSSRPDIFRWATALLEPQWNVFMPEINSDIEEYIEDTLERRLESGKLSIGDPTIILTIRDALLENAHGMFLWVVFQIDSICSQKTDAAILTALEDLPKDLPDTFNRILQKLQQSDAADPLFCKKIFDLVVAAQRPLNLEELREAVSVEPGETMWDAKKLVNDVLKSILDSCGSLVNIDEEHLTVHLAHHSVKQHLLSQPTNSDMKKYHIDMKEADLYLGDVVVTYLNYGIFDRQLTNANSTMLPQKYPSAILGSLLGPSSANKWAMRFLKSRGNSRLDIHKQLEAAAGIIDGSKQQAERAHPFLSYAQEYWLYHTRVFHRSTHPRSSLWQRLINEEVKTITLPWAPEKWSEFGDKYLKWIMQNKHWALIGQSLVEFSKDRGRGSNTAAARLLLDFMEKYATKKDATDMNFPNMDLDVVLYLASYEGYKTLVLLSLRNGANINAEGEFYGTALQAASANGHGEIARLLVENGANVNAEDGDRGTALHAASANGHGEIVRLLLENGANANVEYFLDGPALQAASTKGHGDIAKMLLESGANVNAEGGFHGSALQAASALNHVEIARLLLENGANVNAQGGRYGGCLEAAVGNHYRTQEVVQLLLDKGAIVTDKTMELASGSGVREVKKLIRNAYKSQSSSIRDPTSSAGKPSRSSA